MQFTGHSTRAPQKLICLRRLAGITHHHGGAGGIVGRDIDCLPGRDLLQVLVNLLLRVRNSGQQVRKRIGIHSHKIYEDFMLITVWSMLLIVLTTCADAA